MAKRKDNDEPIDSYLVKDKNEIINPKIRNYHPIHD